MWKRLCLECCYMQLQKCKYLTSIIDDSVIKCDLQKKQTQFQQILIKQI